MQKLLVFLLNLFRSYFLAQCNLSRAIPLFIQGLSIILLISYASTLYQFFDLTSVDNGVLSSYNSYYRFPLFLHSVLSAFDFKFVLVFGCVSAVALFFLFIPFWILILNAFICLTLLVHFPTFFHFNGIFYSLKHFFFRHCYFLHYALSQEISPCFLTINYCH